MVVQYVDTEHREELF